MLYVILRLFSVNNVPGAFLVFFFMVTSPRPLVFARPNKCSLQSSAKCKHYLRCFDLCFCVHFGDLRLTKAMFSSLTVILKISLSRALNRQNEHRNRNTNQNTEDNAYIKWKIAANICSNFEFLKLLNFGFRFDKPTQPL